MLRNTSNGFAEHVDFRPHTLSNAASTTREKKIFKYKTRLWLFYLLVSRLSRALKAKHAGNLCSLHHVQGMILNTA